MSPLIPDLKHAVRALVRAPAFATTAVLTLAVGVAGLTVVFALVNALLLRPLPVHAPAELVSVELRREDGTGMSSFSYPQYDMLKEDARGLTRLAAYGVGEYALASPGGDVESAMAYEVSANYFATLGLRPVHGRFFMEGVDDVREGNPVVVISHSLWQSRFGGGSDVVGRDLLVNGRPLTIVGVAPQGFAGTISVLDGRFWVPLTMVPELRGVSMMYRPGAMYWLTLIGRRAPETTTAQAQALLSDRVRSFVATRQDEFEPSASGLRARAVPTGVALTTLRGLPQISIGPVAGFLGVLFVAALLVLVIASVNITSIVLARITARSRELAVRRSLGASRPQIAALLLAENSLLFITGSALALIVAAWLLAGLPHLLALSPIPVELDVPLDGRVLGFAALVAVLLSIMFGLPPALHGAESREITLMTDMRSSQRGMRLRSTLVVGQVALTLVLLVSAGLLTRALQRALAVDPGFDAASVVTGEIDLNSLGYDGPRSRAFFDALLERLNARSDVEHAGLSTMQPLLGYSVMNMRPEGHAEGPEGGLDHNVVDTGFLNALRVPLTAGRPFDRRDVQGAPAVAIVNETLAARYWPGEDPIGKRLYEGSTGNETAIEVIGVVRTGRYRELGEAPRPFVYLPFAQRNSSQAHVYVRGAPHATDLLRALRDELRVLEPNVPLGGAASLQRNIGMLLMPQRLGAGAIGSFGGIGLLLAAIGIYGLVAFSVAQRRREIGIRMAVGARAQDVVRLFLYRGLRLLLIGSAIGLPLAFGAAHMLAALLYGLSPADPVTFVAVPLVLMAVAMAAAWVPSRRASRTDPLVVLRAE